METEFFFGLMEIILINLVLSGDNAVVIALACKNLQKDQQKKAVFWGCFGAIGLRVMLTLAAVWVLLIPLVQVAGGLLLIYIAIKLVAGNGENNSMNAGSNIGEAIKSIVIADFVMSLDNVLAVAGAAEGNLILILSGLVISIPLIIWGSQLLMRMMNRFPIISWLGAGLLGYTAGEMMLSDKYAEHFIVSNLPGGHYALPIGVALLVIGSGHLLYRRHKKKEENSSPMLQI